MDEPDLIGELEHYLPIGQREHANTPEFEQVKENFYLWLRTGLGVDLQNFCKAHRIFKMFCADQIQEGVNPREAVDREVKLKKLLEQHMKHRS